MGGLVDDGVECAERGETLGACPREPTVEFDDTGECLVVGEDLHIVHDPARLDGTHRDSQCAVRAQGRDVFGTESAIAVGHSYGGRNHSEAFEIAHLLHGVSGGCGQAPRRHRVLHCSNPP
ncbi:hypothetical protein RDE2_40780 [Rhodococcus sp. RDE2]|nr:hypothetical protein RDE2_40780 [Rhodococcus sp. RDE2]